MTRPKMPPTPASSTEIKGQDHSSKLSSLQMTFELPPSAITSNEAPRRPSSSGTKTSSVSPYLQPSETVKARRRSSAAQQQQKEAFALPPPPTRSRKIIQMKPRPQEDRDKDVEGNPSPAKGATSAKNAAGRAMTTTTGKTKKQPSATSAAGKKIARKTAHSLIERRRRSKMNEEFAVLKGLIPACTGEMHKLAILQASIEYVRYLEDCITKLKAQHARDSAVPTPTLTPEFRFAQREAYDQDGEWNKHAEDDEDEEESVAEPEDVEMTDSDAPSPTFAHAHTHVPASRSNHSSVSPTLDVAETRPHATDQRRHYSLSAAAAGTSPAVGPHGHSFQYPYPPSTASASASHSTPLTSPALQPQLEIDHEVSAALLMLNSDRRAVAAVAKSGSARGMSVRDLLSS